MFRRYWKPMLFFALGLTAAVWSTDLYDKVSGWFGLGDDGSEG